MEYCKRRYVEIPFCMIKTWILRIAAIGALTNPFLTILTTIVYNFYFTIQLTISHIKYSNTAHLYKTIVKFKEHHRDEGYKERETNINIQLP